MLHSFITADDTGGAVRLIPNDGSDAAYLTIPDAQFLAVLGPSGSGKSRLALALLQAGDSGLLRFARLIADDRAFCESVHGRLLVRPVTELAGMVEVRGLGIRRVSYETVAVVGAVVELAAGDADRLPALGSRSTEICQVALPRLAVASGSEPLPLVLAYLRTADANA